MFYIITQYSTLKFSMESVEIFSRAHIEETVKKIAVISLNSSV